MTARQEPVNTGFSTRQVHSGATARPSTPRTIPIHLTAGFPFESFAQAEAHFDAGEGFGYTRVGNPTLDAVERKLADLEGGASALLLASGQAAVTVALLCLAGAGDHIVCARHVYEGTRGLLTENFARLGIDVTWVDSTHDAEQWRAAIRPNTKAFFAESISNARNDVLDIAAISAVGRERGIPLVVDNTFATPYLLRPLEHGAAVVVHSASKFLSGQGAVLGGVIVDDGAFDEETAGHLYPQLTERRTPEAPSLVERFGARARMSQMRDSVASRLGPTPSPLSAFFIGQGIETLSLRVQRQSSNALSVARWLAARAEIEYVDYVGLESHPSHLIAQKYLPNGYGSVFTVTLRGGREQARRFIEALEVFTHMTHLGDVRSLVLHPASTSHAQRTAAERAQLGVTEGTVRLSVGIEDESDLIADLDRALRATLMPTESEEELT